MTERGAVTASSAAAAEAGAAILRAGGNAIDAAVATALASCVADPCNTGIGGYGGHMTIAPADGAPVCVDFDMWVPAGSAGAYRGRAFASPAEASCIPQVVAGLARALAEFGTMGWAEASAPAIALARDGVEMNATTRQAFAEIEGGACAAECFRFERRDGADGETVLFRQPDLARTLQTMAEKGPAWFYEGPIGDAAGRLLADAGHAFGREDWADAPRAVRTMAPSSLRLPGATLHCAPLPTSGAPCMFGTLGAGAALAERHGDLDAPEAVAAWARRLASMWTYRFATPDGNRIDSDGLAAWIEAARSHASDGKIPDGVGHTCHLNAADAAGTLVAATLTHGPAWFGARWAVPGTGVVMNAGMHLLTGVDAVPDGARAYAVSNMSPTVARLSDGAGLAVGCPGARRIPSIVGQFLARHLFGGLDMAQAIARGRFHAETRGAASLETGRWDAAVADRLRRDFPRLDEEKPAQYYGPLTAIRRHADGRFELGLDDRWRGYGARA